MLAQLQHVLYAVPQTNEHVSNVNSVIRIGSSLISFIYNDEQRHVLLTCFDIRCTMSREDAGLVMPCESGVV